MEDNVVPIHLDPSCQGRAIEEHQAGLSAHSQITHAVRRLSGWCEICQGHELDRGKFASG